MEELRHRVRRAYPIALAAARDGARDVFFIDQRYRNLKPIGGGSYGVVCAADDVNTGTRVALKKITHVFSDLVDAKRILREIKLLRHFDGHENIIAIRDIITVPPDTTDFRDVYIITNLMESDLDRIIASNQPLTNQHYQYFLYQILRGLKFIHSANVLHRDLKPSNLLVNANCDLAICDFGLARGVDAGQDALLTEYVVTRWYRAPELLCESNRYGEAIDVWSVGCIFAEMLRRKPFFRGDTPQHQLETIVSVLGMPSEAAMQIITHSAARKAVCSGAECKPYPFKSYFPRDTSAVALDLLQRMLVFDPEMRISVEDALQHPYLAELHGQVRSAS
jgi:mitogen-activated protein kinase 1/3